MDVASLPAGSMNEPGFRYNHAPIVEAVLDLQVSTLDDATTSRLGDLDEPGYPKREETVEISGEMTAGPAGVATKTARRANGYRFVSDDGRRVALMRENGFTFGQLAPYDRWSTFSAEGLRLWRRYVELAQPGAVTRLGLRYINRIVPREDGPTIDIAKYLRTRLEISDDMPTMTVGYFLSFDVPLPAHRAMCRVTQTIREEDDRVALVLDIDAYRETSIDPSDIDTIVGELESLRDAKNMVFEASITDESRRLFD